jgi:hypothetical protein
MALMSAVVSLVFFWCNSKRDLLKHTPLILLDQRGILVSALVLGFTYI